MLCMLFLPQIFLLLRPPAGATPPEPRVFAVLAELDRMAVRPLWPGFEPREVPLEIFDGGRTWLLRHPRPPAEFAPVSGRADARVFEGRHESLRANTSIELAGVATAAASFDGKAEGTRPLAALLLHEAFHVFQARRHPGWGGNEADLFAYPVENPEALALRRLESAALARALAAGNRARTAGWAARALELRQERFALLPAPAAAYERGTEMKEGLARYIEAEAAGVPARFLPDAEFAPDRVRERAYASGCAMALLLDRLEPEWKRTLEEKDAPLDEVLGRAAVGAAPVVLAAAERESALRRAAQDVAAWSASRAALRRDFLAAPGWRLVVESETPLFPQGFDPLNVERLSSSEVLHTRWIKLGNAAGALEALDRRCLTESAGAHPLFEGVRRATLTGFSDEPRVQESEGSVQVSARGLTLSFRSAGVSRSGSTVTVSVGAFR
jgi:hypothetical protein